MAITGTKAFTSGEILTANDVNQYLMRGVKVFSSTVVRDAAYGGAGEPVLEEGETCYITATDELQTYNGSSWVKIGPTAAFPLTAISTAQVTTNQTTSSLSYTDLSTVGPTVTLTTGTSVFVLIGMFGNDTGNLGNNGFMSMAISGATTTAASDDWAARAPEGLNGVNGTMGYTHTVTAGSNTFTAKYKKVGGTSTAEFMNRFIMVIAL
jgi:hypothetical protein